MGRSRQKLVRKGVPQDELMRPDDFTIAAGAAQFEPGTEMTWAGVSEEGGVGAREGGGRRRRRGEEGGGREDDFHMILLMLTTHRTSSETHTGSGILLSDIPNDTSKKISTSSSRDLPSSKADAPWSTPPPFPRSNDKSLGADLLLQWSSSCASRLLPDPDEGAGASVSGTSACSTCSCSCP
eukprot:767003-Hanusia_phi.AAC.2